MPLSAARALELRFNDADKTVIDTAASSVIYQGALVGSATSNLGRALVAGDRFVGIAFKTADNGSGVARAKRVEVVTRGYAILSVTGASAASSYGDPVYGSADDGITMTPGANSRLGKFIRWDAERSLAEIYFEADGLRSVT